MTYFTIKYHSEMRSALRVINSTCTYHPIWKLSSDNSISKYTKEVNAIPVPTSLQLTELIMKVLGFARPLEMTAFFVHAAQVSIVYRDASSYEIEIITLAQLLDTDERHSAKGKNKEDPS